MKTKSFLSLILISSVLLFDSCKKGPEDPAFTLRTRKNRVVGEWKLKSGNYRHHSTDVYGNPDGYSIDFTSSEYDYYQDVTGGVAGVKGPYFRNFKFKKDGSVTILESIDNQLSIIEGTWDFNSGIGKDKSKTLLLIHIINYTGSGGVGHSTYTGNNKDLVFYIKQLRNKKMTLTLDYSEDNSDGTNLSISELDELELE